MSEGGNDAQWRKSSYSNQGDCVEWLLEGDVVRLRDSTGRSAGEVQVSLAAWRAFLAAVKAGEADLFS